MLSDRGHWAKGWEAQGNDGALRGAEGAQHCLQGSETPAGGLPAARHMELPRQKYTDIFIHFH